MAEELFGCYRGVVTDISFPPRYQPLAVIYNDGNYNVKLDYFDEELVSSDGELKIHVGPGTQISGTNGQPFLGDLSKKTLLVFYGMSTRSIPAQTTPEKIVVFCK